MKLVYNCQYCGKSLSSKQSNKRHENICWKNPKYAHITLNCTYCGKVCKNPNSLRNHERLCKLNPSFSMDKYGYLYGANGNIGKYIAKVQSGEIKSSRYGHNKTNDAVVALLAKKQSIRMTGRPSLCKGKKYDNTKGLSGGIRKGAGRGKKGWYKGYWCDSSWELAYVIYSIDHQIPIERNHDAFDYVYHGKVRKYYPDFKLHGDYIEIKGYDTEKVKAKIEQFPQDKTLVVYHRSDLTDVFEYVISTYGNDYIRLYEK